MVLRINRRHLRLSMIVSMIAAIVYVCSEVLLGVTFNCINVVIVILSTLITCLAAISIKVQGVFLYNAFLCSFFGVLIFNNFNISALQMEKTITDIYYYFFGPLVFAEILYLFERKKIKYYFSGFQLNPNFLGGVIAGLCIIFYLRVFSMTGIRAFGNEWLSSQSSNYVIQGSSGMSNLFMWLCLMMVPVVNKKLKIILIIIPVFCAFLSASRGDIMRIALYLLMMWMAFAGKKIATRRNIRKFMIIVAIILVFFSAYGNYRQEKRGWNSTIGYMLQSKVDNDLINWAYAYSAINFDVLKLYTSSEPTMEIELLYTPIMRITEGADAVENYYNSMYISGLHGFNAATFLSYFIKETGYFYFFQVAILAIIIGIMDKICLSINFKGGHIFLLMLTTLNVFGNYYLIVSLLYSLIAGMILYFISDIKKAREKTLLLKS